MRSDICCARGLGGIARLRIRYRQYATPRYDVLFASREEVTWLANDTGWVVRRFLGDGPGYVAVNNVLNATYLVGRAGVDTVGEPLTVLAGLRYRMGR